jgi:hypothetical protein
VGRGKVATGWSLAKASWAVLKADRSLAIFPMLALVCAAVASLLLGSVGVAVANGTGVKWLVLLFILAAIYVAVFFLVYFNVALAGAARLSIDGRDTSLRDGLAVARSRRKVIAGWALLEVGLGLLISAIGSLLGGGRGGANPLSWVVGAAWSVASFFVIPVLALEGLGPRAALKRSVALVREHWGAGVVGRSGIGTVVFLVAGVPVLGMCVGVNALDKAHSSFTTPATVVLLIAVIAAFALGKALGIIFRVELYHYATNGKLTGNFAQRDIDATFRHRGTTA